MKVASSALIALLSGQNQYAMWEQYVITLADGSIIRWSTADGPYTLITRTDTWRYLVVPATDTTDYSGASFDDSGWAQDTAPFGSLPAYGGYGQGWPSIDTVVPGDSPLRAIWMRKTVTLPRTGQIAVEMQYDNAPYAWINGTPLTLTSHSVWTATAAFTATTLSAVFAFRVDNLGTEFYADLAATMT